ncbi:hypothetical protein PYCC9005_001028 [Savitreella phatthalungensis]
MPAVTRGSLGKIASRESSMTHRINAPVGSASGSCPGEDTERPRVEPLADRTRATVQEIDGLSVLARPTSSSDGTMTNLTVAATAAWTGSHSQTLANSGYASPTSNRFMGESTNTYLSGAKGTTGPPSSWGCSRNLGNMIHHDEARYALRTRRASTDSVLLSSAKNNQNFGSNAADHDIEDEDDVIEDDADIDSGSNFSSEMVEVEGKGKTPLRSAGRTDPSSRPGFIGPKPFSKKNLRRHRLTHQETRYLLNEFAKDPHPDAAQRGRLARVVPGLSARQIQVWFQNRRAKLKRMSASDAERVMSSRAYPSVYSGPDVENVLRSGSSQVIKTTLTAPSPTSAKQSAARSYGVMRAQIPVSGNDAGDMRLPWQSANVAGTGTKPAQQISGAVQASSQGQWRQISSTYPQPPAQQSPPTPQIPSVNQHATLRQEETRARESWSAFDKHPQYPLKGQYQSFANFNFPKARAIETVSRHWGAAPMVRQPTAYPKSSMSISSSSPWPSQQQDEQCLDVAASRNTPAVQQMFTGDRLAPVNKAYEGGSKSASKSSIPGRDSRLHQSPNHNRAGNRQQDENLAAVTAAAAAAAGEPDSCRATFRQISYEAHADQEHTRVQLEGSVIDSAASRSSRTQAGGASEADQAH